MKNFIPFLYALLFIGLVNSGSAEIIEDSEFSYGTVVSVSPAQLVVSEYDYENDVEVTATYEITPAVKLSNVKAIEEIVPGNSVDIIYVVKDDKKIAQSISVEAVPSDVDEDVVEEEEK